MKKNVVILIMVLMISGYGFAKKSKMSPQLMEEITRNLNNTLYAVVNSRGICANPGYPYSIVVKNAGESKILWEQFDRGSTELKKGEIIVLEKIKSRKSGFRLIFRTLDKRKFKVTKTYTEKITRGGKETEIEREREVMEEDFYRTRIEYRFHERRHSHTPGNIKFVLDTIAQGFNLLKSKEDALLFADEKIGSNNPVEIGMTVPDVVKILGLPKKRMKNGNKMIYKYAEWVIHFVDGKVADVEF